MARFAAATRDGLVVAEPHGGGFELRRLLERQDVRCVAASGDVLLAGAHDGVIAADGEGAATGPEGVRALAASRLGAVYAGTEEGDVWSSRGDAWEPAAPLPRSTSWLRRSAAVSTLAVSPAGIDAVLAGVEGGGVARTEDGGRSWTAVDAVRDPHAVTFHAVDAASAYAVGEGAAASHDGGRTWERPGGGPGRDRCVAVAADPGRSDLWYVGTADGALHRSAAGQAWEELSLRGAVALLTDPAANGVLYAVLASGGVRRSADFGERWEPLAVSLGADVRAAVLA